MKRYQVSITGRTSLLMHHDDIEWSDKMVAWQTSPENQKGSKKGDDRTPAYRWIGCLYHDGTHVALPSDNLMRVAMQGAAMIPVPGGKGGKTFKAQSQSGMMIGEPFWRLLNNGNPILMQDINLLLKVKDFVFHKEAVSSLGFSLFLKRAKIGAQKHVRVRPRFDSWSASGPVDVWDEQITKSVLTDFFSYGGQYKGLGDWRPGGKTPGSFGMFSAEVTEV